MIRATPGRIDACRIVVALVVAVDLCLLVYFIGEAEPRAVAAGRDVGVLVSAVTWWPVRLTVAALGVVACGVFGQRASRPSAGALAVVAAAVLSHVHAELFGSPWRHLYFGGLSLAGWVAGQLYAQRRRVDGEAYALAGAAALLGAAYHCAGLSKVVYGGLGWLDGSTLAATVIAQTGMTGTGPLASARELIVGVPAIAAVLSVGTVGFELGGALFPIGPRVRAIVALGLVGMHTTIFVLTGILYAESIVLLLVLGLVAAEEPEVASAPSARATGVGVGLAVVVTALALVREAHGTNAPPGPIAADSPAVAGPSRVGPFALGDELDGDPIVGLRVTPSSLELDVDHDGASLGLSLTCAESEHRSPFDRGPLHLFYRSTTIELAEIEPIASAVLDRVGPEPCTALDGWLRAAATE